MSVLKRGHFAMALAQLSSTLEPCHGPEPFLPLPVPSTRLADRRARCGLGRVASSERESFVSFFVSTECLCEFCTEETVADESRFLKTNVFGISNSSPNTVSPIIFGSANNYFRGLR